MKKIIYASLAVCLALTTTSCLKDKNQNSDFLNAKPDVFIEIKEATLGPRLAQPEVGVTAISTTPVIETFDLCNVRVGGQTTANNTDIAYKVVVNNALLPAGIVALAAGSYTILNPTGVIPAGRDEVTIKIRVDKTSLGFSDTYGVGIKIESSNAKVNDNGNSYVSTYLVKNQYDGIYSIKGYTLRAGDAPKTGNFCCQEMGLATAGANDLEWEDLAPWADLTGIGVGVPSMSVNPTTNAVTMYNGFPIGNAPGYNSRYVPNTRTFFVSFTWGAGPSARLSTDTLTYLRPRP